MFRLICNSMTEGYYYTMSTTAGAAGASGGLTYIHNYNDMIDYDSGYTTWIDYGPTKWVKNETDKYVFRKPEREWEKRIAKMGKSRVEEDYIIQGVLEGLREQFADIVKNTIEKIEFARKILYQKAPTCPECGADTREVEWVNPYFKCNYCDTKLFPVGEKND